MPNVRNSVSAPIKVALVGVGNCAASLVQGIQYYGRTEETSGLILPVVGGIKPGDIEIVSCFDIDSRKVGRTLSEAIFCKPNCVDETHHLPPCLSTW